MSEPVVGVYRAAKASPDRLALVDPEGREISAGELIADANRVSHGLRSLGLVSGDCIATVLPNRAEMISVYLGAMQIGLYITPINWHLAGPEIAYIVADSEAKVVVGDDRLADVLEMAAKEVGDAVAWFAVGGAIPGFRPFTDLIDGQPETDPENRTAGEPMQYTSGTSGRPKGVRRALSGLDPDDHAALTTGFLGMFGVGPYDDHVHICGSPLYHTAVLRFAASALTLGHTLVLMDKWTPEEMLRLIEVYRATYSHMVPTQFQRLLALPDDIKARYDVSSLRNMIHAAAPCPVDTKRRMLEWWGPVIYEYYAATEGGGTLATPEEWLAKPGTVGKAWMISEVRVVGDDGADCAAGEVGTVYMKMHTGSFEYFKDEEKTKGSRHPADDGFFTVGDIGYLDEDRFLFLRDRKSDMIISGGVNIYPAEIENELLSFPKIADAAVFGIPHPDWGEEVKAVVEAAPDAEPGGALTNEILTFLKDRVAAYKIPKSIDFIDEMPRDPNGKLYKRKLRDPYWEGLERQI
ncbi:MAG TPA: acyl-CoA synthetase [Acidimicrobiia bacterium]|nr:acyl-CoA synthetase [Acidimicrobiia bacterium]